MTHRESRDHKRTTGSFYSRLRDQRRRKDRRLLSETLEPRQLLAGPDLIGVQPNEGALIRETGVPTTLLVSPRELVFRFDDNANIDANIDPTPLTPFTYTLGDSIRITRAGGDGEFKSATAISDLGSGGQAVVEFVAKQTGELGNGIQVNFLSNSRVGSPVPIISATDRTITIDVSNNPSNPTQVQHIISAVASHAVAGGLIEVVSVSGSLQAPVGTTIANGLNLTLSGANAAETTTDFGTGGAVSVRVVSQLSGADGLDTVIEFERSNFGGPANPLVVVEGQSILVILNRFAGAPSTVQDLITAINTNAQASALVNVFAQGGDVTTPIGAGTTPLPTLELSGVSDQVIEPGYVGLGDSPHEVVFRFAEALPDDRYQINILGVGPSALRNVDGELFNNGINESLEFIVNRGPQVVAVVPEPVRRNNAGNLVPQPGKIEVHFSEDTLNLNDLRNPEFYRLIFTKNTVQNTDDFPVTPNTVSFDPTTRIATLDFGRPLSRISEVTNGPFLTGAARLRIGTTDDLPSPPVPINIATDPADTFAAATPLTIGSDQLNSIHLASEIVNTKPFELRLPGPDDAPGVRQIRPDDPSRLDRVVPLDVLIGPLGVASETSGITDRSDITPGISTVYYDFPASWQGDDPSRDGEDELRRYFNVITGEQKERVREVLTLYSEYLGIQFVESNSAGSFSIAVGELYGGDSNANSAPADITDGIVNLENPDSIPLVLRDRNGDGRNDLVVLDFQDFDDSNDDELGGEFFRGAVFGVGQLLGYGRADFLPQPVTQSTSAVFNETMDSEPAFPGVADILNGSYLFRPESVDVDLYRFQLTEKGRLTIEVTAERLAQSSLLDSTLRLYRQTADGGFQELAVNDDYFSKDSLIDLELEPNVYFLGVSASGNDTYDPRFADSGFGGLSEGAYELTATFAPAGGNLFTDADGIALDGDADGSPGGIFNYWFVPADPNNTIYVDKEASIGGNGSVGNPFQEIDQAIAAADSGDTIRVIGNGGADGDVSTLDDNIAYQIGRDSRGIALADGASLNVPQGVNLIIEAGSVFKMRRSRVGVGSTAPLLDNSNASLQILGAPTMLDANGQVILGTDGQPVSGTVVFTSFNDDLDPDRPDSVQPRAGDWGGIDFRGDLDAADPSRVDLEEEGIFLNHIQFADLRYGGGQVLVDGKSAVISPIEMAITRPTVINSRITDSADAAMAASPDTFREDRFGDANFTSDYWRVGPHIRGNTVVDNTINGLFVRVSTPTGGVLQPLTVTARMDDTDIVHVLAENLQIMGTPGGPLANVDAPSSLLIRAEGLPGNANGDVRPDDYVYRISFVDALGRESSASQSTSAVTLTATGSIRLTGLPTIPAGSEFVARRLYRAPVIGTTVGTFARVAELNSSATSYIDSILVGSDPLPNVAISVTARTDAGLTIDPGTVMKIVNARIDVMLGGRLYAEGTIENPVVITSLNDVRYGAGGTFDTNSTLDPEPGYTGLAHGDWAGVYVGFGGVASFDHAVIAGGGGTARIPGGFASFNVIEVHQADLRLANSRLESNADGRGFPNEENQPNRGGRSFNASGTVFVRASQPTIVNNDFIDGHGPAASFDVNSMSFVERVDPGRSTGRMEAEFSVGNSGPLIQGNRMAANEDDPDLPDDVDPFGLNGIEVRGGAVATEVVFDDVDVVHIVRDSIEIPNQYIYGGMRLESDARGSLVVKFQGDTAGIVAGGTLTTAENQFQDIADRIGGSLQIVGHPDFPVVLTRLGDDSIGAGFSPSGEPLLDTNSDGIEDSSLTSDIAPKPTPAGIPLGIQYDRTDSEVDNGTLIDNDIDPGNLGFIQADVDNGGQVEQLVITGDLAELTQVNIEFLNTTYIDLDPFFLNPNPAPFRLADTVDTAAVNATITRVAQRSDDEPTEFDTVISEGLIVYPGNDQGTELTWKATTSIVSNYAVMFTTLEFRTTAPDFSLGNRIRTIEVINYLSSGIGADGEDILYTVGDAGTPEFRAYVIDNATREGFAHGGIYDNDNPRQLNAEYLGWTADNADALLTAIEAEISDPRRDGNIDGALLSIDDDTLPADAQDARGTDDIGTSFHWSLNAGNNFARVTSLVEFIPRDPADPELPVLPESVNGAGAWDGITIREAAGDRNVAITTENEPRGIQVISDTNPIPGQAQFLGELAPNERSGDENRRLGFIVDGSISQPSDIDVYSFIGEAGTSVWLDIDRTLSKLDTVLELIDANGNTLVLSDDSIAESIAESAGARARLTDSSRFNPDNASSLNQLLTANQSPTTVDHQDLFTTNVRDAGMRVILPGTTGQRNLYHIRVRSSSVASGSNASLLVGDQTQTGQPTNSLRRGLTSGGYQLQVRLREADEVAGTQIRYSDVRFAVNGVQVIGGPINSPLLADEYETSTPNGTLSEAQPLGLYSIDTDSTPVVDANGQLVLPPHGPLSSNRLSKSVGGVIEDIDDVDWYRFEIKYDDLQRDGDPLYLSTIFDLDYADGLARSDTALYVFNAAGQLILIGGDSNVSDDQSLLSADAGDLTRGSFGNGDPFIGSSELVEGTYFVAVSNQDRLPQSLNQFFEEDSLNPLLRVEPIDSIRRIAEDRIGSFGGGTATAPVVPLLFDNESIVPYSLDDVMLYVNTGTDLFLVNPFTGNRYADLGNFGVDQGVTEIAFQANGELFAYTGNGPIASDDATQYVRIDSSNATVTTIGGTGITTFHQDPIDPPDDGSLDVSTNTGIQVNGITIASFGGIESGYFVGNRVGPTTGLDYSANILYAFDEDTGLIEGPLYENPNVIDAGAGTSPRELGRIDVNEVGSPNRVGFSAASVRNSDGVLVPGLADGDTFTVTPFSGTPVTFELEQGPTIVANNAPIRDGDRLIINGVTPSVYEFNTGSRLVIDNPVPGGDLAVGTTVTITFQSIQRTFEFVGTNNPAPGNAAVSIFNANGSPRPGAEVAADFADEVNDRFPSLDADSFGSEVFFDGNASFVVNGSGVDVEGDSIKTDPSAIEVVVNETIAPEALMEILNGIFVAQGITQSERVGTQISFQSPPVNLVTVEVFDENLATGLIVAGEVGLNDGEAISIQISPNDTLAEINASITQAITNAGFTILDDAGNSLLIDGGTISTTGNLTSGADATGGTVVGIELVGNTLFALTDVGGLYSVPSSRLNVPGSNGDNADIANPVETATDLVGLGVTFTALRSGPDSVNGGTLQQMLFGITNTGDIYAFNLAGELQPVFAGGRTSISTGIGGARGLDFSTLDYNLWHVTGLRGSDAGHGINQLNSQTRPATLGGSSLAFTFETGAFASNYAAGERPVITNGIGEILNPRQDGQLVENTYNFPGGAKGVVESNPFSLEGYAAADKPTLYFNYYMQTEGDDGSDALRVHVITPDGVEHLVATNNLEVLPSATEANDEFDDPDSTDAIDTEVQPLFDTTRSINDNWRQARIPLDEFAQFSDLRLRIEFATAGTSRTNSNAMRVVSGEVLAESSNRVFSIRSETAGGGNQSFTLQFATTVAFPSGQELSEVYADPNAVAVIEIEGQPFVLDDGNRILQTGQVAINLLAGQPSGTTLSDLSSADIAVAVARATLPISGSVDQITGVYFSDPEDVQGQVGRNDLLVNAVPLPYAGGSVEISGSSGRLGSIDDQTGEVTNLDDVDLVQLTVTSDTLIEMDVSLFSTEVDPPVIRFFDSGGNELPAVTDSATGTVRYTAADDGTLFIGISGAGNNTYDPTDAETVVPGDVDELSSYSVSLKVTALGAIGNVVEFEGATIPITASPSNLFQITESTVGTGTIGIPVSRFMSADDIAVTVAQAISDRFGDGLAGSVPVSGSTVRLAGLSLQNPGPFVRESDRFEFADGYSAGTTDNDFEGVYLDDFIIGFAERGEDVTSAAPIDLEETFIPDGNRLFPNPPRPSQPTVSGAYQLEIRDGSEYVRSDEEVDLGRDARFRTFDTNDRLTEGVTITVPAAADIVDGATFSVAGIQGQLTFEFDLVNAAGQSDGITAGAGRVAIRIQQDASDREVANAIINVLKSSSVQQTLQLQVSGANGNVGFDQASGEQIVRGGDRRINLYGDLVVNDLGKTFVNVARFGLRGDVNRQSEDQGILIIENSRFLASEAAGIDIDRSVTARVSSVDQDAEGPSVIAYPRNLVELNSDRLITGVVVRSNVLAFNEDAGIQISGIVNDQEQDAILTPSLADPIAFDRILNNTLVGGTVTPGDDPAITEDDPEAEVFVGLFFDKGRISFADQVINFESGENVTNGFDDAEHALGEPDLTGRGDEPSTGEFTTSLGSGGKLTVAFTDNFLTLSGDERPDLAIFETGESEAVRVEVSRDGVKFIDVGIVVGNDFTVDLDQDRFGFGKNDRFGFVRITDLRQGSSESGPVGADIDAIGALTTVIADVYLPGSQGIVVQQGAAPTLLNNVLANFQTGIVVLERTTQQVDDPEELSGTVIGGTTYYRNADPSRLPRRFNNEPLGIFPQEIHASQDLFVDPTRFVFTPRTETAIIDSSIDSLEDRNSLISVKGAIGFPPSPIIAPVLDVNGQLRVDDPNVETPPGVGERVFKDRGAEDRADEVGPRAVLVSPRAADIGLTGGQVSTALGTIFDSFDIQLIDGIAPADPSPGVGIDDDSVSNNTILVTQNGVALVEGVDYRFGYDPSDNIIRLTPLAGIWDDDSVYVVRLLDSDDSVFVAEPGDQFEDGDRTNVVALDGTLNVLEADTGINIDISADLRDEEIDGEAITIFDGVTKLTFEFDTDEEESVSSSAIPVPVELTARTEQLAAALAEAINASGLNLTAKALDDRVQLLGVSTLSTAVPRTNLITVTRTTVEVAISSDLVGGADGQTVRVNDGTDSVVFEFDSDGIQLGAANTVVTIGANSTAQQIAEALEAQIALSIVQGDLDLVTTRVINNRVEIEADSPFASASTSNVNITISREIDGPAIGTSPGFGIQIPNDGPLPDASLADGQTFTIQQGRIQSVTFELNFGGGLTNPGAVAVQVTNPTLDGIADALVQAISGADLGLNPINIGDGRVALGGDANYSLDLSNTVLRQISGIGQSATIPVVIPIDATLDEVAQLYRDAIESIPQSGVVIEKVGDRLIVGGIGELDGKGAVDSIVKDDVGNLLQSNQGGDSNNTELTINNTELTIFVGGGFDYGDAPYASSSGEDAARHRVVSTFALSPVGAETPVSADSEARLIDADDDNGVIFTDSLQPGFASSLVINVTNASGLPFQINAWFDWDADGVFEPSELDLTVSSAQFGGAAQGSLTTTIQVPAGAAVGETYARFRLFRPSENAGLGPSGLADSGEVEDYRIIVGNNPFQNPNAIFDGSGNNIGRYDVNHSGFVSAIDALQVINAMRRNGNQEIDLSILPVPAGLPLYPDVNGDGKITALDALNVINKLRDLSSSGEAPAASDVVGSSSVSVGTYLSVGNGVLASAATIVGDQLNRQAEPDESLQIDQPATVETTAEKTSVFDVAAVVELDSIVDSLAEDTADSREADLTTPVDQVFASL